MSAVHKRGDSSPLNMHNNYKPLWLRIPPLNSLRIPPESHHDKCQRYGGQGDRYVNFSPVSRGDLHK